MNYDRFESLCKNGATSPTVLVEKFDLSRGNLNSWRKGGNPSTEVLIKLADYFDVSVDYLLGRTDKPEVNR